VLLCPVQAAGYVVASITSLVAHVLKLVVAPRHRRRGVGTALMQVSPGGMGSFASGGIVILSSMLIPLGGPRAPSHQVPLRRSFDGSTPLLVRGTGTAIKTDTA
jgi:GNAT superfamily N-acetyltransferase